MDTATQAQESAAALAQRAVNQIETLWPELEGIDAGAMQERLMGVLPEIIGEHHEASVVLAADWYTDVRPRSAPLFDPVLPEKLGPGRVYAMLQEALKGLFVPGTDRDFAGARERVGGMTEEMVLSGFRDTIQFSSVADDAVEYWQRIVVGACDWCRRFAGEKYYTAGQFQSHHHCRCTNAPHFYRKWVELDKERVAAEQAAVQQEAASVRGYLQSLLS